VRDASVIVRFDAPHPGKNVVARPLTPIVDWSLACILARVIPIPTTATEEFGLIRKILGGRQDLFADLIAPHLRPLLQMVRATVGGHPDVEDIVQQTALKAFTHLEQFRCEASFRSWLIRIGINEARAWRRKCASSRLLAFDPNTLTQFPVSDQSPSPCAEYERREASVRLRAAMACLPEKYRAVVLLRDFHGFSISEVAGRLGLTVTAVKTRQHRARKKMAKFLKPSSRLQPRRRACR
jgi:RNA polymerase sigma-70 factor (ECF subfamily)